MKWVAAKSLFEKQFVKDWAEFRKFGERVEDTGDETTTDMTYIETDRWTIAK